MVKFTSMSYLKYLVTSYHRITEYAEIVPKHKPHLLDCSEADNGSELNVTCDDGCSDIAQAVTRFIDENRSNTVMYFTDSDYRTPIVRKY